MTMNRVQFHPGLSIAQFMDRYGADQQCDTALTESRWPAGLCCSVCGCAQSSSFRREDWRYFRCTECHRQCSVISGTIFEATQWGLSRWFPADDEVNPVALPELPELCARQAVDHPGDPRAGGDPEDLQPPGVGSLRPPRARSLPWLPAASKMGELCVLTGCAADPRPSGPGCETLGGWAAACAPTAS